MVFGAAYNTIIAGRVIRAARVFASRPSAGLAALIVMNALGLLAGAPIFGRIADGTELSAVFVAGAVLVLGTVVLAPRGRPPGAQNSA